MDSIERVFIEVSSALALIVEAASVLTVFIGSVLAVYRIAEAFVRREVWIVKAKEVWTRYATWLLLGIQFLLAADIIRTVIAPSWTQIGQLAAIAAIRTFLNYSLGHDIEKILSDPEVRERLSPRP
ncbi:MAG TPA: DUF1622 domain-containing protein [Candidatus Binatia bacterium]|nr:DUF1622 domain-containing protein [Candidatus Binatia bacterium]